MNYGNIVCSVIVPVFNEEKVLSEFNERLISVMDSLGQGFEIIYVNDGSIDDSLTILKDLASHWKSIKIISLSRNFGHQLALTAGLVKAKGQAVVTIDVDLQDPPELLPRMIAKWKEGYDVVYGVRKRRKGENPIRLLFIKMFYRIFSFMAKIPIPVDAGDFRLLSRRAVDSINRSRERCRYLRGLSIWVGYKQVGVEYVREKRLSGKSKYSLVKLIKLAR